MEIREKTILTEGSDARVVKIKVRAPDIALKAKPGQFIVLMVSDVGERLPLTVVEKDAGNETITLIFQEAGLTTKLLGKLGVGESLYSLVGPLGHATGIKNYGKVILVGGGVGIAEIYPVAKALKEAGNIITTILGARTKTLLILEEKLKNISDQLHIATDDGTCGQKGFVTDILQNYGLRTSRRNSVRRDPAKAKPQAGTDYGLVYAVGPIPMMRAVAKATKGSGIKTLVSLNALMVDGTGMCGCCRVTVGGQTRFTCIDGPEFDAHLVDWDELEKRNRIYFDKEKNICKLHNL